MFGTSVDDKGETMQEQYARIATVAASVFYTDPPPFTPVNVFHLLVDFKKGQKSINIGRVNVILGLFSDLIVMTIHCTNTLSEYRVLLLHS